MSTIEEIEMAVTRLDPSQYEKFRQWLADYDNKKWDEKLDADSLSGRLDELSKGTLEDLEQGRYTQIA